MNEHSPKREGLYRDCLEVGISLALFSDGTGHTRYKFVRKPSSRGRAPFGGTDGVTVLGYQAARQWLTAYGLGFEAGERKASGYGTDGKIGERFTDGLKSGGGS